MRLAYVMSRFPKVTETFVLNEILALRRRGVAVEVHPLLRQREEVSQPEARELVEEVRYRPFLSPSILAANARLLLRRPRTYLATWLTVLAHTLPSPRYLFGALAILPKTAAAALEMERDGVEHVHAHFANHPALAAFVIHRLTGIPYSFTAHGSDLHRDQTALALKLASAAFAVTVSRANRSFAIERIGAPAEAFQVVPCGVDPERFRPPDPAAPDSAAPDTFRILCVAALRAVKGHAVLIEACRRLAERGVAFRCTLVGDGPLREELARKVEEAGLGERVELVGALPSAEVVRRMGEADVACLASVVDRRGRREGLPVTLMEALACGLPVVASRLSGIPELVRDGETGLLFEPGDAEGLARALATLAGDRDARRALGARGRELVLAEYTLETRAARMLELFRAHARAVTPDSGPGMVLA